MNDQIIILLFLLIGTAATLFLYIWKAKKHMEYRGDERWEAVQNKANCTANCSHYILLLLLAVVDMVTLHSHVQMTVTLNRVMTIAVLYVAFRNILELSALLYYDRRL